MNNTKWSSQYSTAFWIELDQYARKVVKRKENQITTYEPYDYATDAITKLLELSEDPGGELEIKKWVANRIRSAMRDRRVKYNIQPKRKGDANLNKPKYEKVEFSPDIDYFGENWPSIGSEYIKKEEIEHLVNKLNTKERAIIELFLAGYTNNEIASKIGFKNGKIVSTRLRQILKKYLKN